MKTANLIKELDAWNSSKYTGGLKVLLSAVYEVEFSVSILPHRYVM
jgi:hypothetical protein